MEVTYNDKKGGGTGGLILAFGAIVLFLLFGGLGAINDFFAGMNEQKQMRDSVNLNNIETHEVNGLKVIYLNDIPEPYREYTNMALSGLWDVRLDITHGDVRHPGDAEAVRKCLEQNGTYQLYFNPFTRSWAEVCKFSDRKWGWRIVRQVEGFFQEITAFLEENMPQWDVENYLNNGGYMEVK